MRKWFQMHADHYHSPVTYLGSNGPDAYIFYRVSCTDTIRVSDSGRLGVYTPKNISLYAENKIRGRHGHQLPLYDTITISYQLTPKLSTIFHFQQG